MTENKRFHYDCALEKIYDYGTCEDGIAESLDCFDACELLNELDENWIKELSLRETLQLELQRVEEKNKQLKSINQDHKDHLVDFYADYNRLKKENDELKQQLEYDLLTKLQNKCDKKQEHIVVLENKIRRMREAIHKLEWLASHRNGDLQRENWQLKQENKEFKALLDEMSDCNNEIWFDNGTIYRLRKIFEIKNQWYNKLYGDDYND